MSVTAGRPFAWKESRRIRRIAWTGCTLLALVVIGVLASWRIHKESTPDEYTPGEESKDITSAADERADKVAVNTPQPAPKHVSSRVVDRLLNPGHPLPAGVPEPRFTDVTKSAGLASFRQFQGERSSQLPEDMGSGLAWGDFDNDGLDDLFVVSGGGSLGSPEQQRAPSVLYRNLGNERFEKVHDFPDLRIIGMGVAWGDYDNDGWLDLVVTGYDTIILFHNDHGHLVRVKNFPSPKGFWTGVSWGDYNRDGYLDLYVCGYVKYKPGERNTSRNSTQFGLEVPFTLNPASYEPERNLLFRNNGDGTFTEVAVQLGVANPEGRGLRALWHDFDGDGWLDLYVANDISENKLYLNRRGKFVDAGRAAWVEEYRGSMGLAAGDFDRDGDDDLFISHWIAQGFALYQSLLTEQKGTGTSDLHFTDVAATTGIGQHSLQSIGWGTSFVDIDSDGWPDLIVANGSTFEQKESLPRRLAPMPSFLFWNAHGDFFHDLGPWNRSFAEPHVSRGLAVADFDNDGAMDVAIVDQGEGVRLLRNDIPQGNWAEFRLHNRVPPRGMPQGFGDGATVTAWVGGVPLRRTVGSSSYLSQDSHRVHIGLGSAAQIDRLEVRWLRGGKDIWTNMPANHIWDITQGEPQAKIFTPGTTTTGVPSAPAELSPTMLTAFWERQHAAMDAMKREHDYAKAIALFREALAINPSHEDSHYYLANCLAASGDISSALGELDRLVRLNPQNHRAFQRQGELLAASATSRGQLEQAREALNAALRLNSEETGTLLLLAEVELTLGNFGTAQNHLAHVCQANPRATNAWFLRGYIAWKHHDKHETLTMLEAARTARGRDWKPAGSVAEGDVHQSMFCESGLLNVFEEQWTGAMEPDNAYGPLDAYIRPFRR